MTLSACMLFSLAEVSAKTFTAVGGGNFVASGGGGSSHGSSGGYYSGSSQSSPSVYHRSNSNYYSQPREPKRTYIKKYTYEGRSRDEEIGMPSHNYSTAVPYDARRDKAPEGNEWIESYFSSRTPRYGKEVSKNQATRKAFAIQHPSGMYYFNKGVFYFQDKDKYVIHEPCLGFRVPGLPSDRDEYCLDGTKYFYYYGTFYTYNHSGKYYEVVAPPKNAFVDWAPSGGTRYEADGNVYYKVDGVQYQIYEAGKKLLFKVIVVDESLYSKRQKINYYSCR